MRKLRTPTVIRNIIIDNSSQGLRYQISGIVCTEDRPWTIEDLVRWLPDQISHTNISAVSGPGVNFIKKQFVGSGYIIQLGDTFSWNIEDTKVLEDNWHNIEDNNWNYIVNR